MPLFMLQAAGMATGFATTLYMGYALLLDPQLQIRYKHLALLQEVEAQILVDESKMTAELNELERRAARLAAARTRK
jgi:hypothetical protein